MISFNYTVTDPVGIHARPAGLLVKEAKKFNSDITVKFNGKTADAEKLIAIMGMGIKKGNTVTVDVSGDDEVNAADALLCFFKNNL